MIGAALLLLQWGCSPPAADSASGRETGASADPGPQLRLPLEEPELFYGVVGVDHDPAIYEGLERLICLNYEGAPFPSCYDEHDGSDFMLEDGWDRMDQGSTWILAAASGRVVEAVDGHYDRCHGDPSTGTVSCDGHPMVANAVTLEHSDGSRTLYWHMAKDSVAVEAGEEVRCGQRLGRVGSSGNSSAPHLHFELQLADGEVVDPYAGVLSQPESWWHEQGESDELPSPRCPDED